MNDIEVEVYDVDYIPDYKEHEEQRQANELTRIANETTRQANETTRVSNETTRGTNETSRISAESVRVTAEQGRVSAEAIRVSNENARIAAEEAREAVINSLADVATSGKASDLINDSGFIDKDVNNLTNYTTTSSLNLRLAGKQDTLSWDMTPTSGSTRAISSGAVYTALTTKQNVISSSNKLDADLVDDTNATNKFLSAAQKSVIDSVQTDYAHTLTLSQNTTTGDLTVGISNYSGTTLDYGTVEGIATRTYVDSVVGDIETILEELDVGGGV